MKLRVIVPYANHSLLSSITQKSLDRLVNCSEFQVDIVAIQGSNIVRNRNAAINGERSYAILQKLPAFDYLLSLDSDVGFDVDHVVRLLNAGKEIIGGAYQKRERLDLCCAGYWHHNLPGLGHDNFCVKWLEEGLKRVDWLGGGFLLVRKDVLERMEYPWFRYELVRFQNRGELNQITTSDDFGFAMNAARAGFPLWLDCSCKIEHLAIKAGMAIPDLEIQDRISILESEIKALEPELYRLDIKIKMEKALVQPGAGAQNRYARLKKLKQVFLIELASLQKMKQDRQG